MSLMPVELPEWTSVLIVAIGWALLLFVGQGLFIGLVVAAILRGLGGRSADLRYGIACLGLAIMMFCPISTTVWGLTWGRNGSRHRPGVVGAWLPHLLDSQNTSRGAASVGAGVVRCCRDKLP